jgi:hypothetical protein
VTYKWLKQGKDRHYYYDADTGRIIAGAWPANGFFAAAFGGRTFAHYVSLEHAIRAVERYVAEVAK